MKSWVFYYKITLKKGGICINSPPFLRYSILKASNPDITEADLIAVVL